MKNRIEGIDADDRFLRGQIPGGPIEVGDHAGPVGHENARGQRVQHLPDEVVLASYFIPRSLQISDIQGEASRVDELAVVELTTRGDLDMSDGAVAGAQTSGVSAERLAAGEPAQDVRDDFAVGMEIRDVPTDVFVSMIAQKIEFGPVCTENCTILSDYMQGNSTILEEVLQASNTIVGRGSTSCRS